MIVRIESKTIEGEILVTMFGNSYKNWNEQFREFANIMDIVEVIDLCTSPSRWIGWGGLKWCPESDFQHELNREDCQDNEPDNPNPRKYKYMKFGSNRIAQSMARKIINDLNKRRNETKNLSRL